jgi:triosephosphate isomerase
MIIGNWKMNMNSTSAVSFAVELEKFLSDYPINTNVIIAPPYTLLHILKEKFNKFKLAAQDCSEHNNGAYTGEISSAMLKDIGCKYVILGHSERRQYHNETSDLVAKKAAKVIENNLIPIICVGETLQEREAGKTTEVLAEQVMKSVWDRKTHKIIVAYEPVWAIGTGLVPTENDISQAVNVILKQLSKLNSFENNAVILYGGSVKPANCKAIMQCSQISGLLIGGASLDVSEFIKIVNLVS